MTHAEGGSTQRTRWLSIFDYLPAKRRWQSGVVLGLMLMGALAELVTLGAILPFLTVLANPDAVRTVPALRRFVAFTGLQPGPSLLMTLGLVFCAVVAVAAAVRIVLAWATQKFVFRVGYDLGIAVYRNLLHQPYRFHVSQNSSHVVTLMNQVQTAVVNVMLPLMQGISSALIALFLLAGLIAINPLVALVSGCSFAGIYYGVSVVTRSRLRSNSIFIMASHKRRMQTIQEGVGGIRDVILDHAQDIYLSKYAAIDTRLRDKQAVNALISNAPRFVVEGLGMILIILIALFLNERDHGLTGALPVLGALALGAQRMLPLLQIMYNTWTQVMGNQAALAEIMEAAARPIPAETQRAEALEPIAFNRSLALDHVSFRYTDGLPNALDDVSLTIPKGARVGFIGKTGSGKSTAMDILMGLLNPTGGCVRIDGQAVTPTTMATWQEHIAHVPQHIYLSDASIAENIAFGVDRRRIDMERVRDAARRADISDHIDGLPAGYDTEIGERGVRLSGGQRQRIGIARALYKPSQVLVLDEATSALDEQTEAAVIRSIENLGPDLTIIMIAHRLTTLSGCEAIFRLENGRLIERSSYVEVSEKSKEAFQSTKT